MHHDAFRPNIPAGTSGRWTVTETEGGTWSLNGYDGETELIIAVSKSSPDIREIAIMDISVERPIEVMSATFQGDDAGAIRWLNSRLARYMIMPDRPDYGRLKECMLRVIHEGKTCSSVQLSEEGGFIATDDGRKLGQLQVHLRTSGTPKLVLLRKGRELLVIKRGEPGFQRLLRELARNSVSLQLRHPKKMSPEWHSYLQPPTA